MTYITIPALWWTSVATDCGGRNLHFQAGKQQESLLGWYCDYTVTMTLAPDLTSHFSSLKRTSGFMGMYRAALLQFQGLVLCVNNYTCNMEIFPCRSYKLLLSTVTKQEAVFYFKSKLWEKFLSEKTVHSLCSLYAMPPTAPFLDILEELSIWHLDPERINSMPVFLH